MTTLAAQRVLGNEAGFRSTFVAPACGVSFRQLDTWCRNGWVLADHDGGSGCPRIIPETEIPVVRTLRDLTAFGFSNSKHRSDPFDWTLAADVVRRSNERFLIITPYGATTADAWTSPSVPTLLAPLDRTPIGVAS